MTDPEPPPTDGTRGEVWDYLRRRSELDQEIQSKFARPVTVMFTDIQGSTTVFDMRGDIEGVTMLQRHNDRVFPAIAAAGGRIVKQLGDGLMVTFPAAAHAVRSAMEIQRALATFNEGRPEREQIHLRIGINTGVGIVEEHDVFGDVVNAAARVQGLAHPDQVLVTEAVQAEAIPELGTALFRPLGASALKGKLANVMLYEVAWAPEQGAVRAPVRGEPEGRRKVFVLELSRHLDRLKVSSYEQREGEEETLRTYEELEWDEAAVSEPVERIGAILEAGDLEGRIARRDLDELVRLGQLLYGLLLPPQTRERLGQSKADELRLVIDDQLVQIPWELAHTGQDFLCLLFGIGRVVSTPQTVAVAEPREPQSPLRVAVVADPRGDLPEARREGTQLAAQLNSRAEFRVVLPGQAATRQEFLTHFGTCDVLHFAGHADYEALKPADSNFVLADGRLPAAELIGLAQGAPAPRLIFLNACQSGQTPRWRGAALETRVFGLANAVLLTGVKHYIGSLRTLQDRHSLHYALEFYRQLGRGESVGVAVREARRALAKRLGKTSLIWASYVLYGDPVSRYVPRTEAPPRVSAARRTRLVLAAGAAGLAVLGLGLFFVGFPTGRAPSLLETGYRKLEAGQLEEAARDFQAAVGVRPAAAYAGLATVALRQNDLTKAGSLCVDALRLDAKQVGCLLIQGDLHLVEGDAPRARAAYEAALALPDITPAQQAIAHNRLGRLFAEGGQPEQAVAAYTKAHELDARNWESLSNLGALLRRQGRHAEAIAALEKAAALRPDDPLIQTFLKESREAEAVAQDRQRQQRIDTLVDDLVRRYRRGDVVRSPAARDDWTSRPRTLSLLGLESRGRVPFREGEPEFFLARLGQVLEADARVRLVERNVVDKLLGELKLGTSALADPGTALRLGRLLAAHLISVGSIAGAGPEWQLTLRVIETETSTVTASVAQSFPIGQSTREAAELVGRELGGKLNRAYPVRARVVAATQGEVTLNVGAAEGAAPGLRLQLLREGAQGREVVGEVEVVEVGDGRSRAKILTAQAPVVTGLKVLQSP
ncbi:MAG TPA: CHAT domain-containing protein [Methylomirabilota bacterium]|nr:CHAT domain-containing protein [Methylomirabilota bacterium]